MTPIRLALGLAALILSASLAAPALAGEPSVFTLELAVLTVPSEAQTPMEVISAETGRPMTRSRGGRTEAWSRVGEVRFNGLTLALEGGTLQWNGEADPPAEAGVQQLIRRQIRLHAGQPTRIRALVDELHYFEQTDDGLFKLKSVSKKDLPGLLLACEAEAARNRLVEFAYDLRLVVVEGREILPDAPGQPGKPRLARFRLKRTEDLPPDTWHLISGHLVSDTGSPQGSWLLVLIRVSPVEE